MIFARATALGVCLMGLLGLVQCTPSPGCRGPADCPGGTTCLDGACQPPSLDRDGDGIANNMDRCPDLWPSQPLADQLDRDGDSVGDLCDNCPQVDNPAQRDGDGDGLGDACAREVLDEGEPDNNSPHRAPVLVMGRTIQGTIGLPDEQGKADVDMFQFRARAGDVLVVDLSPWPDDSRADPLLVVDDLATMGAQFSRANDDGQNGSAAHLEIVFPAQGSYLLTVEDYQNHFSTGPAQGGPDFGYQLHARLQPGLSQAIEPSSSPLEVELPPGQVRTFSLRPEGPGLLKAWLYGQGVSDPALYIRDAHTREVLAYNDQRPDCPGSPDAHVTLCLTGAPLLITLDAVGIGGPPAPLSLVLELSTDQAQGQTQLTLDLPPGEAGAMVHLPGNDGLRVTAQLDQSSQFSPALQILGCPATGGPPLTLAAAVDGPAQQAQVVALPEAQDLGRHVRVYRRLSPNQACPPRDGQAQRSTVDVQAWQAQPEHLDPAQSQEIHLVGGLHVFELTPPPAGLLRISARAEVDSRARPFLSLRRPSDLQIVARAVADEENSETSLLWAPTCDAPLWLFVEDLSGGHGEQFGQSLQVHTDNLPSQKTQELGDAPQTPGQAQQLSANSQLLSGQLGGEAEQEDRADQFSIEVEEGQELTVRSWAADDDLPPDTVLYLYDQVGRLLDLSDLAGRNQLAALSPFAGRPNGPYVIRLEMRSESARPYRLEILLEPRSSAQAVLPVAQDLCLNEVLVRHSDQQDLNGDGRANAGDQYLELLNISPYPLELKGSSIWAPGGGAIFNSSYVLGQGRALLLFNDQPAEGLFPVDAFGRGSSEPWLSEGHNTLRLMRPSAEGIPLLIQEAFVPAVSSDGESVSRITDGDPQRVLRPHTWLLDSIGPNSPGTTSDGQPFPLTP